MKVLTEQDFNESGDPNKKDTSEEKISADQKFDETGKPIAEEPVKEEPEKEAVPEKGDDKEPLPKPSEEKKYKYASMDDYDKAYKEAERKMHEATMRAADLERKYERPVDKPKTLQEQIKDMTKDVMQKIKTLPADSPTRDEDAGVLWAQLTSDIEDLKYDHRSKSAQREQDTVKRTYDRAIKEGLKSDAELRLLGYEFSRTDPSLDLETRIDRAVESTRTLLGQFREGFIGQRGKDKQEKDELKVLGRGSSRPAGKENDKDAKPSTMSQQLAEMNEGRRLKKEDIWH